MKRLRNLLAIALTGLTLAPAVSQAQDGTFMRLAAQAIESPQGAVQHTFAADVPWVRQMRQKLEFPGPIKVETSVVRRYQQEGCARVRHRFNMLDAALVKGKLEPMVFQLELNVCSNGEPPLESLDILAVEDALKAQHAAEAGSEAPPKASKDKKAKGSPPAKPSSPASK